MKINHLRWKVQNRRCSIEINLNLFVLRSIVFLKFFLKFRTKFADFVILCIVSFLSNFTLQSKIFYFRYKTVSIFISEIIA